MSWQKPVKKRLGAGKMAYKHMTYLSIITWWRDVRAERGDQMGEEFLEELSHVTSDTINWLKAGKVPWWECVSILHICANLKHHAPQLVALLANELLKHTVVNLDPIQTAKLIYSLGVLKGLSSGMSKTYEERQSPVGLLFSETLDFAVNRMGVEKVDTFGLSCIVYGVGKWGCKFAKAEPYTVRTLSFECTQEDRLKAYTEQGLAVVIYSLGVMGADRETIMVPLVVEACRKKRLGAFTEQHFSIIIYGLGLVNFRRHIKLLPLLQEVMSTKTLRRLKDQGLCNTLHGLARMKFKNDALFLPMLHEVLRRFKHGQMSPFQVASVLQACGCLLPSDHEVKPALVQAASSKHVLDEMPARSLANVACAFAKMKVQDLPAWRRVYQSCENVLNSYHSQATELGALCWAVGNSGVFCPSLLKLLLKLMVKSSREPDTMLLKAVSQGLYASRQYCFVDKEFLEFAWSVGVKSKAQQSDWDIIDYTWTLCILEELTLEKFKSVCMALQTAPRIDPPNLVAGSVAFSERVTAIESYIHSSFPEAREHLLPELGFRENRYQQLKAGKQRQPRNAKPSKMGLEVHNMLVKMGKNCESNVLVDSQVVDFRLCGDAGHLIIIADKPLLFHDLAEEEEEKLLGPLSFRIKLLESLGHKVCCVHSQKWEVLDDKGRRNLLEQLFSRNNAMGEE